MADNISSLIGKQEANCAANVPSRALPSQYRGIALRLTRLLSHTTRINHRCIYRPRRHAIGTNAIRTVIDCNCFGQSDDRRTSRLALRAIADGAHGATANASPNRAEVAPAC